MLAQSEWLSCACVTTATVLNSQRKPAWSVKYNHRACNLELPLFFCPGFPFGLRNCTVLYSLGRCIFWTLEVRKPLLPSLVCYYFGARSPSKSGSSQCWSLRVSYVQRLGWGSSQPSGCFNPALTEKFHHSFASPAEIMTIQTLLHVLQTLSMSSKILAPSIDQFLLMTVIWYLERP